MKSQELIFTNHVAETLDELVADLQPPKIFILVDVNTATFVLPRLQAESKAAAEAMVVTTKAGDVNKNLDSLTQIWKRLGENGATRDSMLVNVGGGVVTDMGAFAAATFKRGMTMVNIPTTLLGAVDASVGGKTGINFNNLKNQIGVFRNAEAVIISTTFFNTLTGEELRSGYAEMLKHGLLSSAKAYHALLRANPSDIDPEAMLKLLKESVLVKKTIVDQDPEESGLRRALNLGHTAGHAFETLALDRKSPIPHGYAVAYGLIVALVLSHMELGFPSDELNRFAAYVKENYGPFNFSCDDYPALLKSMSQDKKNHSADQINFTLLKGVGDVAIDQVLAVADIKNALDITRDLMGV